MSSDTVEDRLSQVERELAELKSALNGPKQSNWIEAITGSSKDDPEFKEILRLGKEIRDAETPDGEQS